MKKLLSISVLYFLTSCMTLAPIESRTLQSIVILPNMKKQQIYQKSLQWLAHTFTSAKAVLEYNDLTEGRIIGNIITNDYSTLFVTNSISQTLQIDIKDGKSRLTIIFTSMRLHNDKSSNEYPMDEHYLPTAKKHANLLVEDYKKFMTSQSKIVDSNW